MSKKFKKHLEILDNVCYNLGAIMKEIAVNRKAHFEYFIEEKYECGIALVGSEVKSLRLGHLSLMDSYATIKSGEIFLLNAHIPCYEKTSVYIDKLFQTFHWQICRLYRY